MSATHTPGPWKISGHHTNPRSFEITGANRVYLATAYELEGAPEGPANARLIAAAPELLAALKQLTAAEDAASDKFTATEIDGIEAAMEVAEAAIAKAEGRA